MNIRFCLMTAESIPELTDPLGCRDTDALAAGNGKIAGRFIVSQFDGLLKDISQRSTRDH
ncbi:MAG: hypothetical protein R2681_08635 [Pyrinomonadaceae bacterium]